jgi:hypothetical protein
LEAARQELARAHTEAANATVPAQMLKLASSRIDAESYSKELTTLSLARADLQALSELLREQRKEATAARLAAAASAAAGPTTEAAADGDVAARPPARPVERIILYIDDLDRCQPKDVVRVLQLVHMLLAFELFVVVVAVDARWVEEALRRSYPWLGGSEAVTPQAAAAGAGSRHQYRAADTREIRGSTPFTAQDYLEKIFQIAFWLEPMTTERTAKYLRSLVATAPRESGPVFSAEVGGGKPPGPTQVTRVGMAGIELDQLRALARYAGSSPRRVKRLVNAYRLIKAGLTDAQLAGFLARESDDGELSRDRIRSSSRCS